MKLSPLIILTFAIFLVGCRSKEIEQKLTGVWIVLKLEPTQNSNQSLKMYANIMSIGKAGELVLPPLTYQHDEKGKWTVYKRKKMYLVKFEVNNKFYDGEYTIDLTEFKSHGLVKLRSNTLYLECSKVWQ